MTSVIAISLMLSCGTATNCVDLPKMEGGITRVQPDVKMVIQEDDLKEFEVVREDYGQESLSIVLNDDAASQLAQLTGDHVGQALALIVDGKVLSEPYINSPIQGGRFRVTPGTDSTGPFWDKVPWMKAKMTKAQEETIQQNSRNIVIYVIAALAFLGGSLAYAFGFKKQRS